jgi:hypothetical protein
LIDWLLGSEGMSPKTWLDWQNVPADHAFLVFELLLQRATFVRWQPTTWKPVDADQVGRHLAAYPPTSRWPDEIAERLKSAMDQRRDRTTCAVERRGPIHIKNLRKLLAETNNEISRRAV